LHELMGLDKYIGLGARVTVQIRGVQIAGLPAIRIRDILRRVHSLLDAPFIADRCNVSARRATKIIEKRRGIPGVCRAISSRTGSSLFTQKRKTSVSVCRLLQADEEGGKTSARVGGRQDAAYRRGADHKRIAEESR